MIPVHKRPTLWHTNMEIRPRIQNADSDPNKPKGNAANIIPLNPLPKSKLQLSNPYAYTPHLIYLTQAQKNELERNRPPILHYDNWARIPYASYHLTVSPVKLHTESLTHATYTDPIPGRLPPLIYK
ncbi:hypothetical protein FBUS_03052 [Fasciolopsis buskii]|uniref:Uncharacterized protein n=1 Tax=Fasciolopsis buskii TaxID=27845 RepID=A0A8E0VEP3_9TREM|nr:hypothetical protein FBUS_03052 [Fasciolopsis buski]